MSISKTVSSENLVPKMPAVTSSYYPKDLDERVGEAFGKIINKYTLSALGAGALCAAATASAPIIASAAALGGVAAYFSPEIKNKILGIVSPKKEEIVSETPMTLEDASQLLNIPSTHLENYDYIEMRYKALCTCFDERFLTAKSEDETDIIMEAQERITKAYELLTKDRFTL